MLAILFHRSPRLRTLCGLTIFCALPLSISSSVFAEQAAGSGKQTSEKKPAEDPSQDPTPNLKEAVKIIKEEGKPPIDWLWNDQLKPTIRHAGDSQSLWIFLGTAAATAYTHQQDGRIRDDFGDNKGMSTSETRYGAILGSGFPGIAIALGQMYFDTDDGLQHLRALAFTSATHISIALAAQRERPNGKNLSFPSGHGSSSFATAASLAYSYGPWAGVPAFAAATYIGMSRVANNAHWASDIVAGAGLGIFWARASAKVGIVSEESSFYPIYSPSETGPMLGMAWEKNF